MTFLPASEDPVDTGSKIITERNFDNRGFDQHLAELDIHRLYNLLDRGNELLLGHYDETVDALIGENNRIVFS